nr:hypothetical protein [Metabacillus bambusae]
MLSGYQTCLFHNEQVIVSIGTVCGPFEARGNISVDFNLLYEDIWLRQDSFEKCSKSTDRGSLPKGNRKSRCFSKNKFNFFFGRFNQSNF